MHSKCVITHTWPANEWSANESPADGMASKRSRSLPTGLTPRQREKPQNRQGCIESASAKKLSFPPLLLGQQLRNMPWSNTSWVKGLLLLGHTRNVQSSGRMLPSTYKNAVKVPREQVSNCKFVFGGDE